MASPKEQKDVSNHAHGPAADDCSRPVSIAHPMVYECKPSLVEDSPCNSRRAVQRWRTSEQNTDKGGYMTRFAVLTPEEMSEEQRALTAENQAAGGRKGQQ